MEGYNKFVIIIIIIIIIIFQILAGPTFSFHSGFRMYHDNNVIFYFAEMICLIIINIQKRWHSHQHAEEHAEQLQNEVIIIIPSITINCN
jgi:flagellar basal body-associated protein FliL